MRFASNIQSLSPGAVTCRGLGHTWKPYTAPYEEFRNFKGYNVTLVCDSCQTMKHFMLSTRGEYYPATYNYSDDYLLAKGNPAVTRADKGRFKLQALSGLIPEEPPVGASVTSISSKRA